MMRLPEIDDVINSELAIQLCRHFGFNDLAERINEHPENYIEWVFDGASMIDDVLFASLFEITGLVEIALKHDLKYAYGEMGNKVEKLIADLEFQIDLLQDGASVGMSKLMFTSVDVFGDERLRSGFSWGFANVTL